LCLANSTSQAWAQLSEPATADTGEAAVAEQQQINLDPLSEHLFPPELVLQQAEQLKLEDSQKKSIEDAVAAAREKMEPMRERLNSELEVLSTLLEDQDSEHAKVKEQMDKVLKEERNVKQLHLQLLLYVRESLTPDQQSALQDVKHRIIAARLLQQRLNAKLQRVQQGMKKYSLLGAPPADVQQKLQQFQQLAQQNKFDEAEAVLDDVIAQLESNE
jgi:hypothetical protein